MQREKRNVGHQFRAASGGRSRLPRLRPFGRSQQGREQPRRRIAPLQDGITVAALRQVELLRAVGDVARRIVEELAPFLVR
jgi:hypothetical protein